MKGFDVDEDTAAGVHGQRGTPRFSSRVVEDVQCAVALQTAHHLRGDGRLVVALSELYRRHSRYSPANSERLPSSVVRVVRDYLDDHWAEPVTLAELASVAAVSAPTVVRRFRAEVGMAPHEYLVSRRVDRARALLATGRPVAEVAARTGFADQSHLHRHFTRTIGVTPGRFRAER